MKDRLKEVRKLFPEYGKTQESFAKFLGIPKANIMSYEIGRRTPSDAVVQLICQKCRINEKWLRTGNGKMFNEIPSDDEYMKAAMDICSNNDQAAMKAVISYWKMDPEFKKIFWDKLLEVAEIYKKQITANTESEEAATMEPMTVEEAEAEYIKKHLSSARKKESFVLSTTNGIASNQ